MLAYDFIDQFEDLPPNAGDLSHDPDYEAYLVDRLFHYDHRRRVLRAIATVWTDGADPKALYREAEEDLAALLARLAHPPRARPPRRVSGKLEVASDTSRDEYMAIVERLKEHILAGDVFQAVPSRTLQIRYGCEPFEIYRQLRGLEPLALHVLHPHAGGHPSGRQPGALPGVEPRGRATVWSKSAPSRGPSRAASWRKNRSRPGQPLRHRQRPTSKNLPNTPCSSIWRATTYPHRRAGQPRRHRPVFH
ncbi:chorismate-binding protein [bacterium]|nr:chorismate-binding protein [bacterium]